MHSFRKKNVGLGFTIANSDAGGQSLANAAIEEAWRAVNDLQPRAYGYYEAI